MPTALTAPSNPYDQKPLKVEVALTWGTTWIDFSSLLKPVRFGLRIGGQGVGTCTLAYHYGAKVQQIGSTSMSSNTLLDPVFIGTWIRIRAWDENAGASGEYVTVWQGRILGHSRRPYGESTAGVSAGVQLFTAYEMSHLLRKVSIAQSYWRRNADTPVLDWCPSFNQRDERGLLVGNRTASSYATGIDSRSTYLYGGTSTWTRLQALEYVLWRFMNSTHANAPNWTIGGQYSLLSDLTDEIVMGRAQTVADVLGRIIPQEFGIDYTVIPDPVETDKLQLFVHPLQSAGVTFGGVTMPANAIEYSVKVVDFANLIDVQVEEDQAPKYERIRVWGGRIVSCFSLWGARDPVTQSSRLVTTLEPKWTSTLESEYEAGTGTPADDKELHDKARTNPRFDPVYRIFGAPASFDFHGGDAAPVLDNTGAVQGSAGTDYQDVVRSTLVWTPLRTGFEYYNGDQVNNSPATFSGDQAKAAAWIWNEEAEQYEPVDFHGFTVETLNQEWGIQLTPSGNESPLNHVLALNHYDHTTNPKSDVPPVYDHETLIATIATYTDQRLRLEYPDTVGENPLDGILDIDASDAEFWYLAANTMTGVNISTGAPLLSGSAQVLRNDASRLALIMAGAIARHGQRRAAAAMTFRGYMPWAYLVGSMLAVIETADGTTGIESPITAVEWELFGDGDQVEPRTTVRTGYA